MATPDRMTAETAILTMELARHMHEAQADHEPFIVRSSQFQDARTAVAAAVSAAIWTVPRAAQIAISAEHGTNGRSSLDEPQHGIDVHTNTNIIFVLDEKVARGLSGQGVEITVVTEVRSAVRFNHRADLVPIVADITALIDARLDRIGGLPVARYVYILDEPKD